MTAPYWYTAGELADRQKAHPRESITDSLNVMAALAKGKAGITSALAASQKKASNSVSKPPVLKCECPFDGDEYKDEYTTHCGCDKCEYPNGTPIEPPKKVSENLSITHARELKIDDTVTVSDLFALIDLPYKVTRDAKVTWVAHQDNALCTPNFTLRLEWRGDAE
jgi:hypothetical protein